MVAVGVAVVVAVAVVVVAAVVVAVAVGVAVAVVVVVAVGVVVGVAVGVTVYMNIFPDDAAIDARFQQAERNENYMEWRRLSDWMEGLGALARAYSSASKAEWYERLALRAYQRAKAMEPKPEQEAA